MKKLFTKLLPLFAISFVILLFFIPGLIRGKLPIPSDALIGLYHPWRDIELDGYNIGKYPVKNSLSTDPVLQTYPWRYTVIENFKNLQLPLWNPYNFSGQPLLANVQSSPFNFFNVFFFLFPFKVSWVLQIIFGCIFAGVSMYLFLRSLNLSKVPSIYGSIVLPFSGFYVAWLMWGTIHVTAALLPLTLYLVNRIFSGSVKAYLALTLTSAALLFSGHTQTALYTLIAVVIYSIFKAHEEKSWRPLSVVFISLFLAVVLASPQILPALEFSKLSNRDADVLYTPQKEDWFIPYKHLIQVLAPDFFGNPTKGNYWGVWNYGEFVSFIGILPFILAINGLLYKYKSKIIFAFLFVIALIFAAKNPVSQSIYNFNIPIISSMQPSRLIFILTFCLVALSSIGLESIISKKQKWTLLPPLAVLCALLVILSTSIFMTNIYPTTNGINSPTVAARNLLVPVIFSATFVLAMFFWGRKNLKIFLTFIFVLTIVELFYFASRFITFSNYSTVFPETRITKFLKEQERPFRILSTDRRIANPNSLQPYQIESVSGYDPLYLKKYAQFSSAWSSGNPSTDNVSFNRFVTPQNYNSNFTNLMNVKYVLTFDEINKPGYIKIMDEGLTKLYENTNNYERVFPVSRIAKLPADEEVLKNLLSETNLNQVAYSTNFEIENGDMKSNLQISEYTDQHIQFKINTSSPTPVVISNIYYPGWRAYIDDIETPIHEVNYLLQSVVVPEGEHVVRVVFKSKIFITGLYVSIFGIVSLFVSSYLLWKKYRL